MIGNDEPAVAALFEDGGFENVELLVLTGFGFALDFGDADALGDVLLNLNSRDRSNCYLEVRPEIERLLPMGLDGVPTDPGRFVARVDRDRVRFLRP